MEWNLPPCCLPYAVGILPTFWKGMPEAKNNPPPASGGESRFPLGQTVVTRNALTVLSALDIATALDRHRTGDWGEVDTDDRKANDDALKHGDRLLSVYHSPEGQKFWIITEWDRSLTTVLLPQDY